MMNSYHLLRLYPQTVTVDDPKAQTMLAESQQYRCSPPRFWDHLWKLYCQGHYCQTMALIA